MKLALLSLLTVGLSIVVEAYNTSPHFQPKSKVKLFTPAESNKQQQQQNDDVSMTVDNNGAFHRRLLFQKAFGLTAGTALLLSNADAANASGGATAGKYTTIPIAKRRYYGRVQESVHEFLLMGPAVVNGELSDYNVQHFFDRTATVIVEAKRKDVNGQCTKKDGDCRGREIRDSRYNDMKTSMYLLGNAFRYNQTKAPDNLPTVQAAKKFFIEMDAMEKLLAVKKLKKGDDKKIQKLYLKALDILDTYLDLVELPPTESGHYEQEFSTQVGESSRIT